VHAIDDGSLGKVDNLPADVRDEISVTDLDVRDEAGLTAALQASKPEAVFHLAAIHFIPACERDPQRAISVNVSGTQSVLSAAASVPSVEVSVVASTGAVYAPSSEPHREDSVIGPSDIYGLTKLWTEQLAALYDRRSEMAVGVARLFNVIGPGETNPHLIPAIIAQLQRGSELKLGNLSSRRDYIYVEDIARGLMAIAGARHRHGGILCNIGTGVQASGDEIVEALARIMDRDVELSVDPARMRASDRPDLQSDPSKALELLGWRAQVSLEDALRLAVERPTAAGVVVE
jgi:UDP-glucose 4-epimerase